MDVSESSKHGRDADSTNRTDDNANGVKERKMQKRFIDLDEARNRFNSGGPTTRVNVVKSARDDRIQFPSIEAVVLAANKDKKHDGTMNRKIHLDLLVVSVEENGSPVANGNYLHAITHESKVGSGGQPPAGGASNSASAPAVQDSAPSGNRPNEAKDRVMLNETFGVTVGAFVHATYSEHVGQLTKGPPIDDPMPATGARIRLTNVEPKLGITKENMKEVYYNASSYTLLNSAPYPHRVVGSMVDVATRCEKVAKRIYDSFDAAVGGAEQFAEETTRGDSAGELCAAAILTGRKQESLRMALGFERMATRLPVNERLRDEKIDRLTELANELRVSQCLLPQPQSLSTDLPIIILNQGGREPLPPPDSIGKDVRFDGFWVEDTFKNNVPTSFVTQYSNPEVRGRLIEAHVRVQFVFDKTEARNSSMSVDEDTGEMDRSGVLSSHVPGDPSAAQPVVGWKMTVPTFAMKMGTASILHTRALVNYIAHIPMIGVVRTTRRTRGEICNNVDTRFTNDAFHFDVPEFLHTMGVRVPEKWMLEKVSGGEGYFEQMSLDNPPPPADPVKYAELPRVPKTTFRGGGFANLLEVGGSPKSFKEMASKINPELSVRYYVVPIGDDFPETTPPIRTPMKDGAAFVDGLIAKYMETTGNATSRDFFLSGRAVPFAVLSGDGSSAGSSSH